MLTKSSVTESKRHQFFHRVDWLMIAILLLAAFLYSWQIWKVGATNDFYTVTITSMLKSVKTFWYASFNSFGTVTVNQPPVALWLMAISAKVFGLHAWSIILPSIVLGVGSVALMYQLVTPYFGRFAGRLAALALTLTPAVVANSRTNNLDATLIFTLLLALLLLQKAITLQRLRWLLGSFALVGLAFNVKLLQAFLILPVMMLVYWLATRQPWQRKLRHLSLALLTLAITTLIWPLSVDLTAKPANSNHYVALSLVYNYQANNQVLSQSTATTTKQSHTRPKPVKTTTASAAPVDQPQPKTTKTDSGSLSLIETKLGTQISWLLPFAVFGTLGGLAYYRRKQRRWYQLTKEQQQILLWAGWLLPAYVSFALAHQYQSFYLVMLAPPIAALVGITLKVLIRQYHLSDMNNWQYYLLPLAIVTTACLQAWFVNPYYPWLSWLMLATGSFVSFILISSRRRRAIKLLIATGLMTVAVAPTWWSLTPAIAATNGTQSTTTLLTKAQQNSNTRVSSKLLRYLEKHNAGAKYLFATDEAATAAPYIVKTGHPVLSVSGFNRQSDTVTLAAFKQLVKTGQVRYFYAVDGAASSAITNWVKTNGTKITGETQQVTTPAPQPKQTNNTHTPQLTPQQTTGQLYQLSTTITQ